MIPTFLKQKRLKPLLQGEASDCGLACLTMIANYHRLGYRLGDLKQRFGTSARGYSLLDVKTMADDLGLVPQTIRFDPNRPEVLVAPALVHFKPAHYVVLERFTDKDVLICDPAHGRTRLKRRDFTALASGFALEFTPPDDLAPLKRPRSNTLALFFKGHALGPFFAKLTLVAALTQLVGLVLPFFSQTIFDQVLPHSDAGLLTLITTGYLLVAMFQAVIQWVQRWGIQYCEARVFQEQHRRFFNKLLALPLAFFDRRPPGDILTSFMAVDVLKGLMVGGTMRALNSAITILCVSLILCWYAPALYFLIVVFVGGSLALRHFFFTHLQKRREREFHQDAQLNSKLLELVTAIQAVKIFQGQSAARTLYHELLGRQVMERYRIGVLEGTQNAVLGAWRALDYLGFLWLGTQFMLSGDLSIGRFYAIFLFKTLLSDALQTFIDLAYEAGMLSIYQAKWCEIIDSPDEPDGDGATRPVVQCAANAVEIENLRFRYHRFGDWVFDGLELTVKSGESVAVVGASGRGKTTLCKLILGLQQPESGHLRLAPAEAGGVRLAAVMQHDHLLTATIRDNISFFHPHPDDDAIIAAARLANIWDEIKAMPMGLDTVVGDAVQSLSGGQRQRLLLARALFRKPRILLLDEATSNLDVHNERIISANIKKLNMTRIIFAHRPETIRTCDRVIQLPCPVVDLARQA